MSRIRWLSYNLDETTLELLGCTATYAADPDEFFSVDRIGEIHQLVEAQNKKDLELGEKLTVFKVSDLSVFKTPPSCFGHDDCSTQTMSVCPFLDACSDKANKAFINSYPNTPK